MPKAKTNRSAAKRFKATGGKVIRRATAGRRHLLSSKNRKRKRNLRQPAEVDRSNVRAVKRVILA